MKTTPSRTRSTVGASVPHGIDAPDDRPGVPMEADPSPDPAHRTTPERQPNGDRHLHRTGLDRPTPVFGTAQPPRGLSGMIRRGAYGIPEHYARHWMLLMVADRVDVLEDRLGEALAEPLERIGFDEGARYARTNPVAVLGGTLLGAWIAKRVIF